MTRFAHTLKPDDCIFCISNPKWDDAGVGDLYCVVSVSPQSVYITEVQGTASGHIQFDKINEYYLPQTPENDRIRFHLKVTGKLP